MAIKCQDIEFNGLQINTPDGSGIVFTVNGAEIALAGNAIMSASPNGEMDVSLVTGTGSVSANGKTTEILPGTFVSVTLNENLEAIGEPSDAQPLTGQQASIVCQLYGMVDIGRCDDILAALVTVLMRRKCQRLEHDRHFFLFEHHYSHLTR